jgi:hypothetical protein
MRSGMILFTTILLSAVIPLSAQTQDAPQTPSATAAPAAAPATDTKPKAKHHVYTDEDLRPLSEKCADPSVPVEEKKSCPQPPPADKAAPAAAAAKPKKKELSVYDEYGRKRPVEPDVTTLGVDELKDRVRGMQVQMDRSQESIDTWTKRRDAATTDKDKKMYQELVDTSKQQLQTYTERKKEAEAQLATYKNQ